jgi:uncharacterized membrane protein YfcA
VQAALATPELPLLLALTLGVGVIYGFAGFGAALIFVPVASSAIGPAAAVVMISLFGLSSMAVVLPRAWRVADRGAALTMLGAALLALPLGTWILSVAEEDALRWAVSGIVAATLAALLAGFRIEAAPGLGARLAVGAGSGALGGATGLVGPMVILFHLGRGRPAEVTRADTIVLLTLLGAALAPGLLLRGLVDGPTLWLGALLVPAYVAGTAAGQALFRPGRDRLYRGVAHGVIALAVLVGLPLWD